MIDTSNYIRFERVDSVESTKHGLLARLHGELLRVDVVGDDVVRVKISRGAVVDGTRRELKNGRITLPNDGTAFTIELHAA